ncbi:uncharacterized protein DS421_13g405850 [Arachis hypogaea]|nr:uncharacterized protein DS421_13g405850 [Arachis hypogaea]
MNTAYSPSNTRYKWYIDALRGLSRELTNWASRFNKKIWLQHCDSSHRFGHMTTNLSECMNTEEQGGTGTAGNHFSQWLLVVEKNREGIPKMCGTHCDKRASMFVVEELDPFEGWRTLYMQEVVFKVHEVEFPQIPNEKLWPEWYRTHLHPNLTMRRKVTGRPVFMRFCNKMDEVERQEKRCGLCRQTGHARRGYSNQPIEDN